MLGRQCQLRSFRAHINPGAYTQEWHKDFGYYWDAPDEARHALRPLCINTTFYLTDNAPETGRLTFINNFLPQRAAGRNSPPRRIQFRQSLLPVVRAAGAHSSAPHDWRRGGVLQPHPAPRCKAKGRCRRALSAATWCCTTSRRRCFRGFPLSARRCRPLTRSGTTEPFRLPELRIRNYELAPILNSYILNS